LVLGAVFSYSFNKSANIIDVLAAETEIHNFLAKFIASEYLDERGINNLAFVIIY